MPIYEYECTHCGAVTDIRHGFRETASEPCAGCGGALKRIFRPAGIVFKGSGFYVTDSRKPAAGAEGANPSAAQSEAGGESKADKSETKSDTKSGKSEQKIGETAA